LVPIQAMDDGVTRLLRSHPQLTNGSASWRSLPFETFGARTSNR
jgi:hypothetical protein